MSRQTVNASHATAVGPYSHATWAGDLLFCSGQTPINPSSGRLADGGIAEQTRQCFDNLFQVLEAAGLGGDDVVSVNIHLTDMSDFSHMNRVYATRFSAPYPSRTTIRCSSLPLSGFTTSLRVTTALTYST
ncbi:Rid family detoxifying hydrolase [Neorhizobium galegae]|uniref:RidA family protein n=1 Tax=Neorhizobium galegae TaxID=399 RepID=UPI000621C677|nr:Rid family detoxifying hydrolase [Neorhizobium galegae]MCQ1575275.1 Rid family detoxifying hydrolase [Neorhizobium galegae]MCQ1839129.1 Rid family detoxifying hydrolase [Neorhizobium galegae]UIY32581.1 Rid family detoxifying hydrolase [Neorhizobium galegae]CDZ74152.1 Endoribonuclease L-PSP, putative [Neorhizobium galegae bv. orientalis]